MEQQNTKKYNTLRVVTFIQSALILVAVLFILFSGILNNKSEYLLGKSQSDNGEYVIEIYEVGSPNLFRSNTVKAYYRDANHRHGTAVFTVEVNNGQDSLTKNNFSLEWDGDTAILYLEGSEHTRTRHEINFETAKQEQ
ncbi:MAG: hypothetical protein IJZ57_09975 [Clostridia bacterium]|nr:hypothetical protein [Clostridia bacterium]